MRQGRRGEEASRKRPRSLSPEERSRSRGRDRDGQRGGAPEPRVFSKSQAESKFGY